jgi:hypothetical protein
MIVAREIVSRREGSERALQFLHFRPQVQMVERVQYVRVQRAQEESAFHAMPLAIPDHGFGRDSNARIKTTGALEGRVVKYEIENIADAAMICLKDNRCKAVFP